MIDSFLIAKIRNLIQEEAAYLIAPKTVSVNRLRPDGEEGQINRIVDGVVQWTDEVVVPVASDVNPLMDGVASPGTSPDFSRKDHVHPTDTSRASQAGLDAHIADTTGAHPASAISVVDAGAYYAGTDVEQVLQELGVATSGTTQSSDVQVTPSGLIVCTTDVQSALVKLEQGIDDLRDEFEGHHHDARYGGWRPAFSRNARYSGVIGTTGFTIGQGGSILYSATTGSSASQFLIDGSDYGPNGAMVKMRAWCITETAPTASTLYAGIAYVTSWGAAGTIGGNAWVTGSPASISVPAVANSSYYGETTPAQIAAGQQLYIHPFFAHSVNPNQAMTWGFTIYVRPI